MSKDISSSNLRSKASKDREEGSEELLALLTRTSASDLHDIDPSKLARLTPTQRARLFSGTMSAKRHSQHQQPPQKSASEARRIFWGRWVWNRTPLMIRAHALNLLIASLLVGSAGVIFEFEDALRSFATTPVSLSKGANTWDQCSRLTTSTDGCIYTVTDGFSWVQASEALGITLRHLIITNQHLNDRSSLSRGDTIVVWRRAIPLEN